MGIVCKGELNGKIFMIIGGRVGYVKWEIKGTQR